MMLLRTLHKPKPTVIMIWVQCLWLSVYSWLRPIIKWFLRKTTRLCELQRICYGETRGAKRSMMIEYSLDNTRTPLVNKALDVLYNKAKDGPVNNDVIFYAAYTIVKIKNVNLKAHSRFPEYLGDSLSYILSYRTLAASLERIRLQSYDKDNVIHEKMLLELWSLLRPSIPLPSRTGKHWQNIGFQGDDPATDFRGMGLLGLKNLLYFARVHSSAAQHVLLRSQHPVYGYSFAIVGINISHMALNLLQEKVARSHFYNCSKIATLDTYHDFFSHLFFEFDMMWRKEKPRDIMEFSRVRQKFENHIRQQLENPTVFLKCKFILENV